MDLIEEVAREICRSGKFECGQGRCAVLCMDSLGDVRKSPHGCSHAKRLHGALAHAVTRLIVERCAGVADAKAKTTSERQASAFRPYIPSHKTDVTYVEYECSECGETARNTYSEPYRTDMKTHRLCWTCNYWREFQETHKPESMTIIDGHVYSPGNRTSGEFRGMAGRRFDIEYIAPSIYAGQRTTTFDLWSGSTMPEKIRPKYPDTARFLGGAEKATLIDGTTCWNPSDRLAEPYPLPMMLRPNPLPAPSTEGE